MAEYGLDGSASKDVEGRVIVGRGWYPAADVRKALVMRYFPPSFSPSRHFPTLESAQPAEMGVDIRKAVPGNRLMATSCAIWKLRVVIGALENPAFPSSPQDHSR